MSAAPELNVGDWLDVVDGDGIWNVAQVLRLPSAETVEVTYDCWGDEYNETLPRDSPRIAPFHTHTWAVKCWAKLDTWPWWPALLTVRAPGSDFGLQNLRLEERLLVDFLDNGDFKERCRCWVQKSKIVPFQSDEETRRQLTKNKRRKKSKGESTRSKNLTFSTALLARCDAREDFPEFVEGTLPVQFEHNFTRPTEEVRKEMGEEIWLRGFADNRVNHAATHAYTPVLAEERKVCDKNDAALPKSVEEENSTTKEKAPIEPQPEKQSTPSSHSDKTDEPHKDENTVAVKPQKEKMNVQKRARPDDEEEVSNDTTTARAGKAKAPWVGTQEDNSAKPQAAISVVLGADEIEAKDAAKSISPVNVPHVGTRKYGKTPKVLKTPRRSATNLPPYTPPYGRVLMQVESRNKHYTAQSSHARHPTSQASRTRHAAHPEPRAPKNQAKKPAAVQRVEQTHVDMRRSITSDAKSDDGPDSPIKSLARATKATLRADEKLHSVEDALKGKLSELAKKSAKAEELRNKCAALNSPARASGLKPTKHTSSKETPPKEAAAKKSAQARPKDSRHASKASKRSDSSRAPALARRSSQSQSDIRGLELALDDRISMLQGLDSATTRAEFDAIKADLMNSPEVQAAITRIEHPSYGWTAPAGTSSRWTPSLSHGSSLRAFEKAKSRYSEYLSTSVSPERRPSPRSPSQHFGRSWGYEREDRSSAERLSSPSSSPPADHNSFGFSVNDNFSMNQWYRDLYPKAFNFQQP